MNKVGVLIATYGRTAELEETLNSLIASSTEISALVVCDATPAPRALDVQTVCLSFADRLPITYVYSDVASSCVQRNIAAEHLLAICPDLDYVQVLDDDTCPEPHYMEKLASLLDARPEAVGASGMTITSITARTRIEKMYSFVHWLVGLESRSPGKVSRAGCGMPARPGRDEPVQVVEWLFGCSMWRANIFKSLRYLDRLPGAALFEDTEFSVRASAYGSLLVDPSAVLNHSYSSIERPNLPLYAHRFSRNRWYVLVAKKKLYLDFLWYFLSVMLLASSYFVASLRSRDQAESKLLALAALATLRGAWDGLVDKEPI